LPKEDYRQFIPSIIADLSKLGKSEGKSLEFENKIHCAFQMLGYNVERLGQGTGRNPEGIARAQKDHYAILYDAKSRQEQYSLGTDDRIFKEYLNKYKNVLQNDGYDKIYFFVISHKFATSSQKVFDRFFKETHVPLVFLTTEQMLRLIAKKIEWPIYFDLGNLENLFATAGLIDAKKLDEYLNNVDKERD